MLKIKGSYDEDRDNWSDRLLRIECLIDDAIKAIFRNEKGVVICEPDDKKIKNLLDALKEYYKTTFY